MLPLPPKNPSLFSMATTTIFIFFLFLLPSTTTAAASCLSKCGPLSIKYPFGTGAGCGDPRFHPSICCDSNQLLFTTHTGSYPITSIDYSTSTITITDPRMSTCSAMQTANPFGIDWDSPFQLGNSVFLLLACSSSSGLTYKGNPLCDTTSNAHVCASLYSCPAIMALGLPVYSPTAFNSCCVYSPLNLGPAHDLNLQSLHCSSYSSVVSLGDYPTDPNSWVYGISLRYSSSSDGFANNYENNACGECERSGGVCGYSIPRNSFLCVCSNGFNTTLSCYGQEDFWNSNGSSALVFITGSVWWDVVALGVLFFVKIARGV